MSALNQEQGIRLVGLARAYIDEALGGARVVPPSEEWLSKPAACFVTLTSHGELRGCIGSILAQRLLSEDLKCNARAAAFEDPRFLPLTSKELDELGVEVSVLSPPEKMEIKDFDDACRQLVPFTDGVVLRYGTSSGIFLPQVWEKLPDPREFLVQLSRKAGLRSFSWSPEITLHRFAVQKFKDHG